MREEERRSAFKKTVLNSDGRRRREETTRQIRKAKKDENLLKRRMAAPVVTPSSSMDSASSSTPKTTYTVADIPQLAQTLQNPTSTQQQIEEAVRGFRRILSLERNPPVNAVLQAGVLPTIIECLTRNPQASVLIFEAAWALTNIASTEETRSVVQGGAVPHLIQLLCHQVPDVREQAAWCLGNIAGDHTDFRDYLLQHGALEPLLMNIREPGSQSLLSNVTWTVSNLCRGKPVPALELVAPAIPVLADLLKKGGVSDETLIDATWALSYLSDGPNERIEAVMSTGVVQTLVGFLGDKSSPLLTPTIRCLGNFVTGSDDQTQAVVDAGILDHLLQLLESGRKTIRKESCWLLSNITAGTQDQIRLVTKRRELLHSLMNHASDSVWEVRKEAIWALSNICTVGNDIQVMGLVQSEGLRPLVDVLGFVNADSTVLVAALDAVEQVLAIGARHNKEYGTLLDDYNGIDYIEQLQEHPSNAVYEKTLKIIETYFGDDGQEDENMAPQTTDSGTFEFGLSESKQSVNTTHSAQPAPLQFSFPNIAF